MNYRKPESRSCHILAMLALSIFFVIAISFLTPHIAHAGDVNNGKINLTQGDTKQLRVQIADAPKIDWTSSNTRVCAAINSSGLIQAIGPGTCTIFASVPGQRYFWTIKVNPLRLNKSSLVLLPRRQGADLNLTYKKANANATWSSSNPHIAAVNGKGTVVPVSPGVCTITATWNNISVPCSVQVLETNPSSLRQYCPPKSNRGRLVIVGSALMDYWATAQSDFGSTKIINNAISHTTLAEWRGWRKKLITDYKPKAVVICLGTEDLDANPAMSADDLANSMQDFIRAIHRTSKKAKVFFVSIPLYPTRQELWDTTRSYNSQMRAFCAKNKYLTYLNLSDALMAGAVPNHTMFNGVRRDLSAAGYQKVKKVVCTKKVKKAAK